MHFLKLVKMSHWYLYISNINQTILHIWVESLTIAIVWDEDCRLFGAEPSSKPMLINHQWSVVD